MRWEISKEEKQIPLKTESEKGGRRKLPRMLEQKRIWSFVMPVRAVENERERSRKVFQKFGD